MTIKYDEERQEALRQIFNEACASQDVEKSLELALLQNKDSFDIHPVYTFTRANWTGEKGKGVVFTKDDSAFKNMAEELKESFSLIKRVTAVGDLTEGGTKIRVHLKR